MSDARRILFFDAAAGASGDMILGALVDVGVPLAAIRRGLEGLPLDGWKISSRRIRRVGNGSCPDGRRIRGSTPRSVAPA